MVVRERCEMQLRQRLQTSETKLAAAETEIGKLRKVPSMLNAGVDVSGGSLTRFRGIACRRALASYPVAKLTDFRVWVDCRG